MTIIFLDQQFKKIHKKLFSKLKVDFIDFKPNFKIIQKTMLESLKRRGDFCWHCHVGITAFPINTALEKNIKLIFMENLLNIVLFMIILSPRS